MKNKFELISSYLPAGDQPDAITSLYDGFVKEGKQNQVLLGVTGSGKTFTAANLIQKLQKKTLVLAPNKTLAAQLFSEFKSFFPNNAVEYFVSYYDYYRPEAYVVSSDTYIEKDSAVNDEIDRLRHSATRSLMNRDDCIVIASVSCIYGIGSPQEYQSQKFIAIKGDEFEREKLFKKLLELQFKRNDYDFSRGNFRVRGELLEIHPMYEDSEIIRLEFFDDILEFISIVDPISGEVRRQVESISIYPATHYMVTKQRLLQSINKIRQEMKVASAEFEGEGKFIEAQRIKERTSLDLEMIQEIGYCSGIENYSRYLNGISEGQTPPTLLDYFGDDYLLIVDESHMSIPQLRGMYNGDKSRKQSLVNFGFRLPSALDNRPLQFKEFEDKIKKCLYISATPGPYELELTHGELVEQIIRPTGLLDPKVECKDAKDQVENFLVESKKAIAAGFRVLGTTLTKKMSEKLAEFYQTKGMKVKYLHSDISTLERVEILQDLRKGTYDILIGINLLREGLDLPEVALVGIFDADKEGFLRSETALIQTIGRAARNSEGRVILYAYGETKSMQKAISETKRRRAVQESHNFEHNITPKTIVKGAQSGIMEALGRRSEESVDRSEESLDSYSLFEINKKILFYQDNMKKCSDSLDFEKAIFYRNKVKELKELKLLID